MTGGTGARSDPALAFLNHGSYGACPKDVVGDYQRWQLELKRKPVAFLGAEVGSAAGAGALAAGRRVSAPRDPAAV